MKHQRIILVRLMAIVFALALVNPLKAANYYVDPATGSMSNDGSEGSPWSTFDSIFSENKTLAAGDTIYLKNGEHGWAKINNKNNSGIITIMSYPGHNPIINRLDMESSSNWVFEGVQIHEPTAPPNTNVPLEHPVYGVWDNYLVRLTNTTNTTFDNCYVYSIEDSDPWTGNDWIYKAWNGIYIYNGSSNVTVKNCLLKNLNFVIDMNGAKTNTIQYNTIRNFCGDGIRVSTECLIEYNEILDSYDVGNHNHDDAMQAFASRDAIVRGNTIINTTSASRSFISYGMQGIGFFDGFFNNYLIENNLVVIHTWHGISLYGATACSIINNTVVDNPIGTDQFSDPWILIEDHKNNTPSSYNVVNNNITSTLKPLYGATESNNIVTTNYTSYFVDYYGLDFHLKPFCSANNSGNISTIPTHDLDKVERENPCDIGCYEFVNNSADQTAPDSVAGLDTIEVLFTSVEVIWNSSEEENIRYRVYLNGSAVGLTTDTTYSVLGLIPETDNTVSVGAVDTVGNESELSKITFTTPLTGLVVSTGSWQTLYVSEQRDTFTVTFEATPTQSSMNTYIGIIDGLPVSTDGLTCAIYFNSDGQIQAKNGDEFSSDQVVNFTANTKYSFRLEIDVIEDTYSIYVTPEGGTEIILGEDYAFTDAVSSLDSWTVRHYSSKIIEVNDVRFITAEPISNLTDKLFNNEIVVYPNPVNSANNLIIELSEISNQDTEVKMYDVRGGLVLSKKFSGKDKTISLPLNSLGKGMYLISVENGLSKTQQKLIVR